MRVLLPDGMDDTELLHALTPYDGDVLLEARSHPMLAPYVRTLCSDPMFGPYVRTLCSDPVLLEVQRDGLLGDRGRYREI